MNDIVNKVQEKMGFLTDLMKGIWDDSLIEYLVHTPTTKDALMHLKYWAVNQANVLNFGRKLVSKVGLMGVKSILENNPWILYLLKSDTLVRRLAKGKTGRYHESICVLGEALHLGITELLEEMYFDPSRLVIIEDMLPPDLFQAMGLKVYNLESFGLFLPMLAPDSVLAYIDEAENAGVNPDSCSLPRATIGMVKKGHLPKGLAIVTSNLPCDSGMSAYSYYRRAFNLPIYHLDVPFNFYDERAEDFFVKDLKDMIAFLEQHTPGRMDWDKFREMCINRNRMLEVELELWDMLRVRPAPLAGEAIWLSHFWHYVVTPGKESSANYMKILADLAAANLEENTPATINENYRTLLWNAPFFQFIDIFNWAENNYGITILMDSLSYNHYEPIDVSTPESMLKGWGRVVMQGPMVRHNRGPAENYIDDLFRAYKQFDIDMVWVANHVGCKSSQSLNGMMREQCRAKGIPLLMLDYDLIDPRIVSHDSMLRQVEHFMDNVMKAKKLGQ